MARGRREPEQVGEQRALTASDRRIFIGHSATLRVGMVIFVYTQHANNIGKGCLVDRSIPIHARTLGLGVPPRTRWACTIGW